MMYSHPSGNRDWRQHRQRGSRQRNDYDDREEEMFQLNRSDRDVYYRYDEDGHNRIEITSRSREYSDSPNRMYCKDLQNRGRKSPVRRHVSLPDRSSYERKRRSYENDYKDPYRQRCSPDDKTFRESPESFSHVNLSNDFQHTLPDREDFRYKKTQKDSRQRHLHQEPTFKHQYDDHRALSPHSTESDPKMGRKRSQKRTGSPRCSIKRYSKPRERKVIYADFEERTRIVSIGSSEQLCNSDDTNQSTAVPKQKPTNGFQRFLDVLNKGVNVAMLTKIVTQTSTGVDDQLCPMDYLMNSAECLRPSVTARGQKESQKGSTHWREEEQSDFDSSQPYRMFSPRLCPLSEQSLQKSDVGQSNLSSCNITTCTSVWEKMTLTHEDEHKRKQMQGVLQAIGLDLGFEELGQMSHRIQERLYGRKGDDRDDQDYHHRESEERDTRRFSSPSHHRRSSPSRSNVSPLPQDCAQNIVTDLQQMIHLHQADEFCPQSSRSSSSSPSQGEKCDYNPQERSEALENVLSNPAYTLSEAPVTPVVSIYSPFNYSGLPCPPTQSFSPSLSPSIPHAEPGHFLPHMAPILSYPHVPPLNILPAILPPNRHLLPQHLTNNQSAPLYLQNTNPTQPMNATQKSKTLSRPRCLQVIETKQPG